jgi:hypothetical protein
MTIAPALLFAAAGTLISSHQRGDLAKFYEVSHEELDQFMLESGPLTWAERLASHLAKPAKCQELTTLLTSLARLENQYLEADAMYKRNLDLVDRARQASDVPFNALVKVEAQALRAHQHAARIHRDLEAAQKRHEAYVTKLAQGPELSQSPTTKSKTKTTPNPTLASRATSVPPSQQAANHQPQDSTPPPSESEFKSIIHKNLQLINETRSKDRPTLIAKLISEQRQAQAPNESKAEGQAQYNGELNPHSRAA